MPGLEVQDRYNYAQGDRLSIRGFGARTQFGIRGVRVVVDGIPATLADGQTTLDHLDLGTVYRVETIRGPTSSLYGHASGGVVRFETGLPEAAAFSQDLGTVFGNNRLLRLESSTTARTGRTSMGLYLTGFSYDGYRKHSETDKLFASGTVRYHGQRDDLRVVANFVSFEALNPGSLTDSMIAVDATMANPFNVAQQTGKDASQGQLGIAWDRSALGGRLEVSAYGLARDLFNTITVRVIELDRVAGGARVQFERVTPVANLPLRWVLGIEAAIQNDARRNFENDQGEKGELTVDEDQRVASFGPFVQLSLPVVSRLNLLTGLRYDQVRFTAEANLCEGAELDTAICQSNRTMDAVSPSVGLLLDVADPLRVYGNISTGFETPTTTELGNRPDGEFGFDPNLEPQRTVSVEFGVKGQVGDGVRYEATAYSAKVTDELVPFEVPSQPGRTFFQNAGSAVHRGLETGVSVRLWQALVVNAAYTYTDARFEDFTVGDTELSGNRIPGVAPHRTQILVSYQAEGNWYVTADGEYASEMPVNDANDAVSPSYLVFGLRAGMRRAALGRWSLEPYIGLSNIFDVTYNGAVTVNAFGDRYFEPGPARALWVGARLGFGLRHDR
jgi:iron complex outermembrane receptor protein